MPGWNRPIRDDIGDHAHGTLEMQQAIAVSCNAYFAQLGVFSVGAQALDETAEAAGNPRRRMRRSRSMIALRRLRPGASRDLAIQDGARSGDGRRGRAMPQGRWVHGAGTIARMRRDESGGGDRRHSWARRCAGGHGRHRPRGHAG